MYYRRVRPLIAGIPRQARDDGETSPADSNITSKSSRTIFPVALSLSRGCTIYPPLKLRPQREGEERAADEAILHAPGHLAFQVIAEDECAQARTKRL